MKVLLIAITLFVLSGCSTTVETTIETSVDISTELSAAYCGQEGFSRFNESRRYYIFTCKDGGVFKISNGN